VAAVVEARGTAVRATLVGVAVEAEWLGTDLMLRLRFGFLRLRCACVKAHRRSQTHTQMQT